MSSNLWSGALTRLLRSVMALVGFYFIALLLTLTVQFVGPGPVILRQASYTALFWEALLAFCVLTGALFYRDRIRARLADGATGRLNAAFLIAVVSAQMAAPFLFAAIGFAAVRSDMIVSMAGLTADAVGMDSLLAFAFDQILDLLTLGFKPMVTEVRWGSLGVNANALLFSLLVWLYRVYSAVNLLSLAAEFWNVVKPKRRSLLIAFAVLYFAVIYFAAKLAGG